MSFGNGGSITPPRCKVANKGNKRRKQNITRHQRAPTRHFGTLASKLITDEAASWPLDRMLSGKDKAMGGFSCVAPYADPTVLPTPAGIPPFPPLRALGWLELRVRVIELLMLVRGRMTVIAGTLPHLRRRSRDGTVEWLRRVLYRADASGLLVQCRVCLDSGRWRAEVLILAIVCLAKLNRPDGFLPQAVLISFENLLG